MIRLKNTLAEDLIAAKKDVERLSEHNHRLNKEKEELTKERGNLVVDLTGTERDNQTLNSVIHTHLVHIFLRSFFRLDDQCLTCRVRMLNFINVVASCSFLFSGKKLLKAISMKRKVLSVNSMSNVNN